MDKSYKGMLAAGAAAGAVTGLFGAGGGMVLLPLMTLLTDLKEDELFPSSITVILPICLASLTLSAMQAPLPWAEAFPYLVGGGAGGLLAGRLGKHVPLLWLHRGLGLLILWGGWRFLRS